MLVLVRYYTLLIINATHIIVGPLVKNN